MPLKRPLKASRVYFTESNSPIPRRGGQHPAVGRESHRHDCTVCLESLAVFILVGFNPCQNFGER